MPALRRICMSDEAIRGLTSAINRLSAALESRTAIGPTSLAASPTSSPPSGEYQVCYPPTFPFPLDVWVQHCRKLSFHGADTGPPEIPDFCLQLGEKHFGPNPDFVLQKVSSAFEAGFWAKAAIDCCIRYSSRKPAIPGEIIRHIIVLRSSHYTSFRVNCWQDFCDLCDITDEQVVYESFSTFAEVQLFCAGAGLEVPALKKWINRQ